mmetsp:Transcript_32004/g.95595  ORF Transcript_32004/g.95595 Transcript_32004/m.95595 type:complete len:131 (-) Transcript_32004:879-1271(-)
MLRITDGPMASEPPGQASDIKLILSGKFLDATKPLSEYKRDMGELGPEDVVTLHVVVRVTPASEKKTAKGEESSTRVKNGRVAAQDAMRGPNASPQRRCNRHSEVVHAHYHTTLPLPLELLPPPPPCNTS